MFFSDVINIWVFFCFFFSYVINVFFSDVINMFYVFLCYFYMGVVFFLM